MSDFSEQLTLGQSGKSPLVEKYEQPAKTPSNALGAGSPAASYAAPYVEDQVKIEAGRAQNIDRYQIDLPDEDYAILNEAIANAEIPEEEAYRWATAIQYTKMYNLSLPEAYQELENLNQTLFGDTKNTPKTAYTAVCDALAIGQNTFKRSQLGIDLKAAYDTNNKDEIDRINAEIDAIDQTTLSLADSQPRSWMVEALKMGAQSAPFTGYTALAGVLGSLVMPGVGTLAAYGVSANNMTGGEYIDLMRAGASHEVASSMSLLSGSLQGVAETALGNVAGLVSKTSGANTITSSLFKRMHVTKAWTRAARVLGEYAGEVTEEGFEEAVQSLTSDGVRNLAAALEEDGVDPVAADAAATNAWESFKGGMLGALVLGVPGGMINAGAEFKDAKILRDQAESIDSKEAFLKESSGSVAFAGLTDKDRAEAQEAIWNAAGGKREERINAAAQEIAETTDSGAITGEEGEEGEGGTPAIGAPARLETGRLHVQEGNEIIHNDDGSTTRILKAGDPTRETSSNRYGYIKFREYDDRVVVDEFRMGSAYKGIQTEFFQDFSERVAGKQIEWEPSGSRAQALKDSIIQANPSGAAAGLQYFSKESDPGNIRGRVQLDQKIATYFPKMDTTERAAATALLETRAAVKGMDLEQYLGSTFEDGVFSPSGSAIPDAAQAAGVNPGTVKGGVSFKDVAGTTKALIYVTENSDFSTYVHEMAHVFRREMEGSLLAEAETAFGVQEGKWTRDAEEKFAVGFEEYLREGKAPSEGLAGLYRKMAEFLHRVYAALANRVEVSPDIRRVYDQLLAGEGPLSEVAREEVRRAEAGKTAQTEVKANDIAERAAADDIEETVSADRAPEGDQGKTLQEKTREVLAKAGELYKTIPKDMFFQAEAVKKLLEQMSREELLDLLHKSDSASGLANYRAYRRDIELDGKWPVQASLDADSLKWVNDNMGHSSGDQLLAEIGSTLSEHEEEFGVRAYHKSGDEFLVQAKTVNDFIKFQEKVDKKLKSAILEVTDPVTGHTIVKEGIFLSAGIDNKGDMDAADRSLEDEKRYRESTGERAGRGEIPPGIRIRDNSGRDLHDQETLAFFERRSKEVKQLSEQKNTQKNDFTPENVRALRKIIQEGGDILFQAVYHGTPHQVDKFTTNRIGTGEGVSITEMLFQTEEETDNEFLNLRNTWSRKGVVIDIFPNIRTRRANVKIKVAKESRGQGLGSHAMEEACVLADQYGIRLELSPTDEWGSSKTRLIQFYKRFGFVENKGRNKDYEVSESMYRPAKIDILFQTEEDLIRDAANFATWQDFLEYYEEGAWTRPEDAAVPENADAQWYQTVWEKAKGIIPEESLNAAEVAAKAEADSMAPGSPATVDAMWLVEMRKPGKLEEFLKQINWILSQKSEFAPADESEQVSMEATERMKRRITVELRHGSWISNATRLAAGRELTEKARRTLLSLMAHASRDYRALYADIMEDEDWAVALADTESGRLASIADPEIDYTEMTPEQRRKISERIENAEIAEKLKSGDLTLEEAERHIKYLNSQLDEKQKEIRAIEKEEEAFKAEVGADYRRISDWETRRLLELKDDLDIARAKHESRSDQTSRMIERGQAITKKYQLESQQFKASYDTIFRKFSDLSRTMEISGAVKTALARRESLFEARAESARLRSQISANREARKIRTQLVKKTMRKVRFGTVDYDYAKKIIAIQRRFSPALLKGLNKWIGTEGPYLREIYSRWKTDEAFRTQMAIKLEGKRKWHKMSALLDKPFDDWTNTERETALEFFPKEDWIEELNLDSLAKERDESLQLDETSDEFKRIIAEALPARILARIDNRPFAEWTIEEMEELAAVVDKLYSEGKVQLTAKKDAVREDSERLRAQIKKALLDPGYTEGDTPEERDRKKKALEEKLGYGLHVKGTLSDSLERSTFKARLMNKGFIDANVRRVARILDGGKDGINTDLLYHQEDACYNAEHRTIRERNAKITQAMAAAGVTLDELYQRVEIKGLMEPGKSEFFTIDELLFVLKADEDKVVNDDGSVSEQSKRAIMYGNLLRDTEKETYGKGASADEILQNIAEPRYNAVLAAAQALPEKYRIFADSISTDYADQYERMNEASIAEFNQPVWRVKSYVPLVRLESGGDTNENRVAEDLLNMSSGRKQTGTDKGMTQKRIDISAAYQRPVQLGLYSTWVDSVKRTEHFIAYAPYVRELNRVYKGIDSGSVRGWIRNRHGDGMVKYIDQYVNEVANPDAIGEQSKVDRVIKAIRGRTASAYLAWKMSGIMKQFVTSPAPYFAHVNPAEYASAAFDLVRHYKDLSETIREKSVFMDSRVMDPVIDLIREQQAKSGNKAAAAWNRFTDMGMKGLEFADWSCVAPGWLAVYRKTIMKLEGENATAYDRELSRLRAENNSGPVETMKTETEMQALAEKKVLASGEIESRAVKAADDVTRLCQPSSRLTDLAPLFKERGKGTEALKILTQFQTSLNVIWQNIRYDLPQAVRDKEWGTVVGTVGGYVAAGIAVNMLTQGFSGGDDDDTESRARDLVYYSMTQFTDAVPLVGDAVNAFAKKAITGSAGSAMGEDFYPALSKVFQAGSAFTGGDWAKGATRMAEGLGYAFGAPVSGVKEAGRVIGLGDGDGELKFTIGALVGRR